jgi:prepilin-type N-terminal cleavage/methylation domain-containing protein
MKRSRRDAFTLAEMLVVIAIILILAALLVPAVYMGLVAAKNAAIAVELGQLDAAMKQYKTLYNSYPPNDPAKFVAHIKQSFGRYTGGSGTTAPPTALDPAEALVFWLRGYSDNPIDPLGGTRKSLMQFDETRLKTNPTGNGLTIYYPPDGQQQPYIYVQNLAYGTATYTAVAPGKGVARAYKSSAAGNPFVNVDSFQIICAGLDGDYGTAAGTFPNGPHAGGDKDNLTNFSGGTLQSKVQ